MNNLLTRELPLHCTIRLWDTYLAESDGFAVFQLYVCAAFLLHWREQLLQEKDFQVCLYINSYSLLAIQLIFCFILPLGSDVIITKFTNS